jgi:hypothetical protein
MGVRSSPYWPQVELHLPVRPGFLLQPLELRVQFTELTGLLGKPEQTWGAVWGHACWIPKWRGVAGCLVEN